MEGVNGATVMFWVSVLFNEPKLLKYLPVKPVK